MHWASPTPRTVLGAGDTVVCKTDMVSDLRSPLIKEEIEEIKKVYADSGGHKNTEMGWKRD